MVDIPKGVKDSVDKMARALGPGNSMTMALTNERTATLNRIGAKETQPELAGIPPKPQLDTFAFVVLDARARLKTAQEVLELAKETMAARMKKDNVIIYCYIGVDGIRRNFEIDLKESLKIRKEA